MRRVRWRLWHQTQEQRLKTGNIFISIHRDDVGIAEAILFVNAITKRNEGIEGVYETSNDVRRRVKGENKTRTHGLKRECGSGVEMSRITPPREYTQYLSCYREA